MSWYANYYIGKMDKDGMIYPYAPYDDEGKLKTTFWRSRSFASDLWRSFSDIDENYISEALRKEFEYEDWNGKKVVDVTYLPLDELPSGDFIRKGYFLLNEIAEYEKYHDEEIFTEFLTEAAYLKKMESELKFGKPSPKYDCEGNEFEYYSCAEYGYYAYPQYISKEYEAFAIRTVAEIFNGYELDKAGEKIVILCTTG